MERRYLLFTAGGEGFALGLGEVVEVRERADLFPLPRVPEAILGLMNYHGNLTAILDFAAFIGSLGRSDGKLLVLDPKLAALALWVDEVKAIVPEEAVEVVAEGERPWETATLNTDFGTMTLLRLEGLLEEVEQQLTMDN